MSLTAHGNDVELPQDQEPLNPDAMSLPAKPWSRRIVLVAVTVGIVAILGTLAILGSGASGLDASVDDDARTHLLQQYAQMHGKGFAPLLHMADADVPELKLTGKCKKAFIKQAKKNVVRWLKLMITKQAACFFDAEAEKCKQAEEAIENIHTSITKACKTNGHVCTFTAKDKEGEETEKVCIPSDCHDEADKIAKFIEKAANHAESRVEKCKDFKCEATITCGEEDE